MRVRASHESGASAAAAVWPAESDAGTPDSWGLATLGDGPPTVTVPPNITVPADSPAGAAVE
jgi:hypothetical protein